MADSNTKQQTTPTDSLPSSSTITDPRKKELFELARKKIVRADVASDGKVDQKDNELRTQALEFVAKECLGLPEKQLLKLVKKIVESLEKKEVEKNALLAEMKAVHTSTVADIERVGAGRHVWNKIRGAYEVAAEKTVDVLGNGDGKIAKFVQDRELHSGARKEMFRSMFALAGYDFKQSATHLHFYMETEAKRAEFTQEISKEAKCVIGFCTNWSEKHPVYEQLVKMGLKTVADKVTIERNVMRINNPKWIEGDKAEAAIKTKLDIENGYRKKHYVFENEFQPSIKPKESADFIESLVHSNRKKSKGEFLEDLKADPHAMAGLIFHWKPGHPTIKELENRGDKVALKYMEEVRSEALVKCKIEPNAINKDYKEHRKYV